MKTQRFFFGIVFCVLLIVMVFPFAGCAPSAPLGEGDSQQATEVVAQPTEAEEQAEEMEYVSFESEVQSDKKRVVISDLGVECVSSLVEGNTAFALDLYQAVREDGGNLFYSPYSISLALAMTYAGAKGETAAQMASTLHYTLPQEKLHPAFNALDQRLANVGADVPPEMGEGFQLSIANAIWGQREYVFLPEFLDILAINYGAGLRIVDFAADPEGARETINQWVRDQTEEKIQNILPSGSIVPDTRMVLGNAIYFNASWAEKFSEDLTQDGVFYPLSGEEVTVPMMQHDDSKQLPYRQGNGFQAVELPYIGNEVSMLVLVPDAGAFSAFEEGFSSAKLAEIREGLKTQPVSLTFPKFAFEAPLALTKILPQMGMPLPLTPSADFSGMTGDLDLFISDVFHKAYLSVDEEGTEAAAATMVAMKVSSLPTEGIELIVDRPFLFLIQEKETGTILFLGRVLNPAQ